MVLIEDNCTEDLDQLALDHYQALIRPRINNGSYHSTQSLIGRIEHQLSISPFPLKKQVDFWKYLLANHHHKLQRIICGRPEELAQLIDEIDALFGNSLFSRNRNYHLAYLTPFGNLVKTVFNYNNYRSGNLAIQNSVKLNVNYCPYCNLQETQIITTTSGLTGNEHSLALHQLDHFYPQSRHPYLGVSFFNLIPGCAPCNATLKGEKDFNISTHFNPFNKSFNDFFRFRMSRIVYNKQEDVEIFIESKQPHGLSQIRDFVLISRYNHSTTQQMIFNMMESYKNRSPAIQRSIAAQIKGLVGSLATSNNMLLKSQGVPLESTKINDHPRGKLKRDICIQLRLIQE